ncbi:MAG TPA: hypothetical protein VEJ63_08770 [Planctomycetota bacterium]|nr:hypothetical protein [Planctomycetota bacterium]
MRDTVIVAEAATIPEFIFLKELLEAEGIPVISHGSNTVLYMRGSETAIRVPRRSLAQARTLIETARNKVEEKRIEDAFEFEAVAENHAAQANDPTMQEMRRLLERPYEERMSGCGSMCRNG